jgi:serine/threonine-protein kinase RsbW
MGKRYSLRIDADLENLARVRRFVEQTAAMEGANPAAVDDLVLAVDEALTNVIAHGYGDQSGQVEVEVERVGDRLTVCLRDRAPAFDPTAHRPPDLTLPLSERAVGGMGIYLMCQSVDDVVHRAIPGEGNELTLVKTCFGGKDED